MATLLAASLLAASDGYNAKIFKSTFEVAGCALQGTLPHIGG